MVQTFLLRMNFTYYSSFTDNNTNRAIRTSRRNNRPSLANDSALLSRYVAARLDLPVSQYLLDQQYKLPIIRRCWEDQLRMKGKHLKWAMPIFYQPCISVTISLGDDFMDDSEPLLSCLILQKQIDYIQGIKENIVTPSIRMKQIRERELLGNASASAVSDSPSTESNASESQNQATPAVISSTAITAVHTSANPQRETSKRKASEISPNSCLICCSEERRLACIPCGHLVACTPCAHSLQTCPVCRKAIEAFVRIYLWGIAPFTTKEVHKYTEFPVHNPFCDQYGKIQTKFFSAKERNFSR